MHDRLNFSSSSFVTFFHRCARFCLLLRFLRRTDVRAERLLARVEPVGLGAVLLMLVLVVDLLVYVLSLTV